jgi:predicted RNase H-like HicB family nuclease
MKQMFTAHVWKEDDWYIAQALEVDVASQGESTDEALENLREALKLYFEPPTPTVERQLHHIEVEIAAA